MTQQPQSEAPEAQLREYPIQLADAFCVRSSSERRARREDDPRQSRLSISLSRTTPPDGAHEFNARIRVEGVVPIDDNEIAEVGLTVQGVFRSEQPLSADALEAFAARTPLVMLWPYARGYFSDLGRMMGVALPPLPTLDAMTPAEESAPISPGGE